MQTPLWICNDSTEIRLSAMTNEHIMNVIRYLRAGTGELGDMLRSGCDGFSNGEWLALLQAELQRRARTTASGTNS